MHVRSVGSRMVVGTSTAKATPLLAFLAEHFIDEIARIWPAPHEGFFILPTARRHALGVVFCGVAEEIDCSPARLRNWLMHARDSEIARDIAGDASAGLIRLLAKMGEQLWRPEEYRMLIDLFREEQANLALRHMQVVTPAAFAPLQVLPAALRQSKILANVGSARAASDLALAFALAVRMKGEHRAARIVARWGKASSRARLFEMAREDLCPDQFQPYVPLPVLPPPFQAIMGERALDSLALEFANCLRNFREDVARGRLAVFAWRGDTPAALALSRDIDGWRLAEAEAPRNEDLDEAALRQIVPALHAAGIRTGPSINVIANRLDCHGRGEMMHDIGTGFVDRLELGDMWN